MSNVHAPRGVHARAHVDRTVSLGRNCSVGSGAAVLGRVQIHDDVKIEANAVVYGPVEIGRGTYVGPNCVLGFPARRELQQLIEMKKPVRQLPGKGKVTLDEECIVRSGCVIYSDVVIGRRVAFGHNAMVREGVRIGEGSLVGTAVVIDGSCTIGRGVSIQTGVYVCTNCTIEDYVFLGPHCVLTNDKYAMQKKAELVGPILKRGASVGANAVLMPGVVIEEGAVVGAQALVNTDVPPRSIYVGIPARELRKVPEDWQPILSKRQQQD